MATEQEFYDRVHRDCAALLITNKNGQPKMIGKQAAVQLLRNINLHPDRQGGSGSLKIMQKDVVNAGLDTTRWDEAVKNGLLLKHVVGDNTMYEMPHMIKSEDNEHEVPNTLMAQLEFISGKVKATGASAGRKR